MTFIKLPEWRVSPEPVAYLDAVAEMESRVAAIESGTAPELIWLLEHPPLYTAGTSTTDEELRDAHGLPVFETGRGGRLTYHGPGQRVIYVLRDLRHHGRDVRAHVAMLEDWVIRVLHEFGIVGERREGRIGIWVVRNLIDKPSGLIPPPLAGGVRGGVSVQQTEPDNLMSIRTNKMSDNVSVLSSPPLTPPASGRGMHHTSCLHDLQTTEEKIAAIGVRVRKWVAYHGLALNVNPNLDAFKGIVPCGLLDFGVTSLHALGVDASMDEVDAVFKRTLQI
jgi:lipoyl(octanoyl) transferase